MWTKSAPWLPGARGASAGARGTRSSSRTPRTRRTPAPPAPAAPPVPRAARVGAADKMADDNTIIEGTVKFRDGKKAIIIYFLFTRNEWIIHIMSNAVHLICIAMWYDALYLPTRYPKSSTHNVHVMVDNWHCGN